VPPTPTERSPSAVREPSVWSTADGFHFVYQPLSGDGTIVARVASVSPSSTGGVMIRETLNANAAEVFPTYYAQSTYMNYRSTTGGTTTKRLDPARRCPIG